MNFPYFHQSDYFKKNITCKIKDLKDILRSWNTMWGNTWNCIITTYLSLELCLPGVSYSGIKAKKPRFETTEIKTIKTKIYANINYAYFKMKCAHSKEFREGSFRERKIYLIAKDCIGHGKAK